VNAEGAGFVSMDNVWRKLMSQASIIMRRDLYGGDLNEEQIKQYLVEEFHKATRGHYRSGETVPISVAADVIQKILEGVWQHAAELARQQHLIHRRRS